MNSKYEVSKRLLSPVWNHLSEFVVERAQGAYIYTTCGRKVLDFSTGIGVVNTGHCHPRVVQAAQKQAGEIIHGQLNIVFHKPVLELVEELAPVVPKSLDQFFFSNSGAEAIEASIKLARHATKKPNIITFQGSFHGRTVATMTLSNSKILYRNGYGPLMSGVHVASHAYCHRCPMKNPGNYPPKPECGPDYGCCNDPLLQVDNILRQQSAPWETAAILVEPILGEGGYVMPPKSFLQGLRKICDQHKILLIFDEVQTGFARTGKYFGLEHYNVVPDILVFAKGIASGFPLSGLAANSALHKEWQPGTHGGTFGANAVSCAAAVATQRVIKEENLVENSRVRGMQLKSALLKLKDKYPQIADVRGIGCMIGVEFHQQRDNAHPFPGHDAKHAVKYGFAGTLTKKAVGHDLLLLSTGSNETIRFIPPLIVTQQQVDDGVALFEKALQDTIKAMA
jgi:4-aminobutyrate aminotransferase